MITLTKSGNAIVFTFDDNDHYLNDGIIEVPVNSLTLVTDESQMATFKRSSTNDIFISARYDELGMSKADLESWFKENACGSTGGGGVTPEEVQTMIDESISGKADSSTVTSLNGVVTGHTADTTIHVTLNDKEKWNKVDDKLDASAYTPTDLSQYWTSAETENAITAAVSGKADTSDVQNVASDVATVSGDVNTLSGSVNALTGNVNTLSGDVSTLSGSVDSNHNAITALNGDVQTLSGQVETDEKVTANALVDLDNRKLDASAYTPTDLSNYYTKSQTNTQINNATSGLVETSAYTAYTAATDARLSEDEEVTSAALNELNDALDDKADTTAVTASIAAAVSGKQDTLVSGTNIKTINNESLLGSGNIDIQGGGKTIVAGRGIAVTTGATADTVSFNLPISAETGNTIYKFVSGSGNTATNASNIIAIGDNNTFEGQIPSRIFSGGTVLGYNNVVADIGVQNTGTSWSTVIGRRNKLCGDNSYIIGVDNDLRPNSSRRTKTYVIGYSNKLNSLGDTNNNYIFGHHNNFTKSDEFALGKYNNSISDGTTSGNTFFSIGNGTDDNARHNAFEIRQNGDIYITSGGTDIKLQDNLGGGGGGVPESAFTAYTAATDARLAEDEEVTAAALNTLSTALGGLKLVNLTQAQYDALATKDASTLYIITNNS